MLRSLFRFVLRIFVALYRLSGGRVGGRVQGLRVLLLTTTGRKSGTRRTTPLGFFEQDDAYVVIASNAGSDTHPAWFYNLRGNPAAKVEIMDRQIEVNAEVVKQDRRSALWNRLVELAPGYGNYAKKTRREIPLVILHPVNA